VKFLANQSNFNQKALRTLVEKYLATTILQKDILGFLEKSTSLKRSIVNLLAEKSGKSANTVYKNINELEIYNSISLLRYWKAMVDICQENGIKETELPNLNTLLLTYKDILSLIIQITTEDQIEVLIKSHTDAILQIVTFYKSQSTSLTEAEEKTLQQLRLNPIIKPALDEREEQRKKEIIERMRKK